MDEMSYEERANRGSAPHSISLEERSRLTISGVEDVESFDESSIVLSTRNGDLIVRGSELHIEKLSLDGGDLLVEGSVDSLSYEERQPSGGFFSRLLRP